MLYMRENMVSESAELGKSDLEKAVETVVHVPSSPLQLSSSIDRCAS